MSSNVDLGPLRNQLEGELHQEDLMKVLYATDGSIYRELPLAVAFPKHTNDLLAIVAFARQHQVSLIPRTAGTSLGGQCVGSGMVVDVSRYMTQLLEVNPEEQYVWVQPGVIRDELNRELKPYGLFFAPNTSTSNRCMIGGMTGNNSSGTTSIEYGSTRDNVLAVEAILSDGSLVNFGPISKQEFDNRRKLPSLEGKLYEHIYNLLTPTEHQQKIIAAYPKKEIHRRNTGYALDILLQSEVFGGNQPFNFSNLLCGSEGTLALFSKIKLRLHPLPLPHDVVLCAHFTSIHDSMVATTVCMQHHPSACELMDKKVLDCTLNSPEHSRNRFFIEGDPHAVLMVEFRGPTQELAFQKAQQCSAALQAANLGYAFPIIHPPHTDKVWHLRRAGLGLLSLMQGKYSAVECIEDTAVALEDLPAYIDDFAEMMKSQFNQDPVYYAHAGAGELHLRPLLDLKTPEGRQELYDITHATATLVKKYRGSLSGEHGDGRVRAPFIPLMVGQEVYQWLVDLKSIWDPQHLFNPGKIVNAAPMNAGLRYEYSTSGTVNTVFDFRKEGGLLAAVEQCSGSGDCRKLNTAGGTMCPSYQATRSEKETTRGRANALREFLTRNQHDKNPLAHAALYEVMDLCLSCKACSHECPSNVDMATIKAEFLYQYYQHHPIPWRNKIFAHIGQINRIGAILPSVTNAFLKSSGARLLKQLLGVHASRTLPLVSDVNVRTWFERFKRSYPSKKGAPKVALFLDEFSAYNDSLLARKSIALLTAIGWEVLLPYHEESGRAAFSKGLLQRARKLAVKNVNALFYLCEEKVPIIGIEPSAILSFRDEYPKLVPQSMQMKAQSLAANTMLIDEFLASAIREGKVSSQLFTKQHYTVLLHGHCHQKALSDVQDSAWVCGLPEGYQVEILPTGCCGMAGSFGYEEEHFQVSMQIGEISLFPLLRKAHQSAIVAATGTSCRHQIADGTGKKALHPAELLYNALLAPPNLSV